MRLTNTVTWNESRKNSFLFVFVMFSFLFSIDSLAQSTSGNLEKSTGSDASSTLRYADGEELLLSLVVNNYVYGEVYSVVKKSGFYLSLDDFLIAANFNIARANTNENIIYSGWWLREENTIELVFHSDRNILNQYGEDTIAILHSNEMAIGIPDADIYILGEEIFVKASRLASIFNSAYDINQEELHYNLTPNDIWPFEAGLARENRKILSRGQLPDASEAHYDFGYFLRSDQTIDFVGSLNARNITEDNQSLGALYSLLGRQDLFGLSTRFYFSGNDDDLLNSGSLDFSRLWLNENSGPFGIRQLSFGDVRAVRTGDVSSTLNRGIFISNEDLNNRIDQELFNIEGQVQNEWDVELYHNNVLIKQTIDTANGRYEFLDIPLNIGLNEFEVVKYGPQGQVEKENISKYIDRTFGNIIKPLYSISLTQNNTSFTGLQETADDLEDSWILSGRYGINISQNTQINASHAIDIEEGASNLYELGFSTRPSERFFLSGDIRLEEQTSRSASITGRTFGLGQNLNATLSLTESLNEGSRGDNSFQTALSINGPISIGESINLFQQSELSFIDDFDSNENFQLTNRISTSIKSFALNHSIEYQHFENKLLNESTESLFGGVGFTKSFGRWFNRTGLNYNLTDGFDVQSAFTSVNLRLFGHLSFRNELSHNFIDDLTRLSLSADWQTDLYAINARLTHTSQGDTSFSLTGRISLSEAPTEFGYIQNRHSLTNRGVVLVRVFHDTNNNLIYDADDVPIHGAIVRAVQSRAQSRSDIIGIAQLDGLSNYKPTDLILDLSTLSNPYLVHSTFKTSVTPRPGLLMSVNYPLVEGAEIDGEIKYFDEYNRVRYLANAPINIKDHHGNVVASVKSSFDGYFYYTGLVPHTYTLEVDNEYLDERHLVQVEPAIIKIDKQGQQLLDFNIVVAKAIEQKKFIVRMGEFTNSSMLDSYLSLLRLKKKLPENYHYQPFQYKLVSGKYSLGLFITEHQVEADMLCLNLGENCIVESFSSFKAPVGSDFADKPKYISQASKK